MVYGPKDLGAIRIINYGFRLAAALLSVVYLASIGWGMALYSPWQNQWQSELKNVDLVEVPFRVGIPQGLRPNTQTKNNGGHFVFGTPLQDSIIIDMQFFPESSLNEKADKEWLLKQREELLKDSSVPSEVKKSIYFRDSLHGGLLYYQQKFKNSDLIIHTYVLTHSGYMIKLGLIAAENIKQANVDVLANKIIDSIHIQDKK
jgi:hypothetical protein